MTARWKTLRKMTPVPRERDCFTPRASKIDLCFGERAVQGAKSNRNVATSRTLSSSDRDIEFCAIKGETSCICELAVNAHADTLRRVAHMGIDLESNPWPSVHLHPFYIHALKY